MKTLAALLATTALAVPTNVLPARAYDHHPHSLWDRLQGDADELLRQGAPGVLVGLDTTRHDFKVRSGWGDVDAHTRVPWHARFRIGSFTKPFVAATLLQLVGEGRLSLDDTVDRWLPGLVRGHGNDGRRITVRQLLQHTSGLPDYVGRLTFLFDEKSFQEHRLDTLTPRQVVELAMRSKPEFAPGTRWSYSNTNYVLAGMIIHRVTGHSWQSQVRRRILEPQGLRHTYLPRTSPDIPGLHSVGYQAYPLPGSTPQHPAYGDPIDATRLNPSWGGAAGEIISTVEDGNRFLRALVRGRVLKPRELAEMTTTVPTNKAFRSNWPGARYGLGLLWVPNSCGGSWAHGGDIDGFMTRNGVTPDGSRSVMVSVNTDSPQRRAGVPAPTQDITAELVDHALCGSR